MENDTEKGTKKAGAEERRKKIRVLAKRLAEQGGKDWKTLTADDRKALNKQAREGLKSRREERTKASP